MKKSILVLFLLVLSITAQAQFRLVTNPPLQGGNGSAGVTFNLRSNISIYVDTIWVALYGTGPYTVELWHKNTPVNGVPGTISSPVWTQTVTQPATASLNTSFSGSLALSPIVIPGGGLLLNAGDHYAFAVGGNLVSLAYTSWASSNQDTFTDGNIVIQTGTNIGYGGWPTPTFHPRQFNGGVSYRAAAGRDLRPTALISPTVLQPGANLFTFRFQNSAMDPISSADLGFQVNNDPPVFVNNVPLANLATSGATQDYTFSTPVNLVAGQAVQIKVWSTNANGLGPDTNPGNDTLNINRTVPGLVVSIASGNWSNPATWDVGRAPNALDTVLISTGHTVTSDLANQSCTRLTVQGIFTYGTAPADFRVLENLTVSAGGLINVFQGTTGKILRIGGHVINNGRINASVGTTSVGTINLFGSSLQTVSGNGSFGGTVSSTTTTNDVSVINILVIENTAPGWPNIDWQIPGTIRFKGGLNLQRGKINLNGNTWIIGNYNTAPTLTCPDTCGIMNGTIGRWWATGTGGTTISAGAVPTTTTGLYPFYSANGARRHLWLQKAGTTTGNTAGELMATFNSGATVSGVSYVDTSVSTYTVDTYNDDRWTFTAGSTYLHAGTHSIAFAAPGTFSPNNNNHRAMLSDGSFIGRHQNANGLPLVQRINLTTAQLTSTPGFVMGYNSSQLCAPQNQFTENFDTYATGSIVPNCWARLIVGSGTQTITTTTPASSPNNMYQYSSSAANQSFVILPETVNLSGGTHRMRFKLRIGAAGTGRLEVGYLTSITDASTFTAFEVLSPTNTAYGAETYVNIPAGIPANARIAIANRGATTAAHYWDDFIFEPIPACPNPMAITISSIASSSALVNWTGNSSALYYEVALQAPGSGIPTGTGTLVTAASYGLSGLSPNTSYEIYVRSACGGVFSNWEGPRVFTTTCVTASMPYLRDFNTWPPSCWNLTGGTQNVAQANNDYLFANFWGWTSGNFALATTEPISISAPARLKFSWSHLYSTTYPNDQLILQAQVVGSTSWDTLLNLIGPTFTTPGGANTAPAPAANFIQQTLLLPTSYVGQEVIFRYRLNSGFGPNIYIDNFIVEEQPPCPDPTAGSAVNIGVNDATGTWSPVPGANSYEVAILPAGSGLPTGSGITTTDTFYAFSGLQPQSSYSYFVRVSCAAGVGTWYGPITFRTLCGPVNTFFEDFESYSTGSIVPECWSRLIVGSATQTISSTTPASGIRNMYQFSAAGTASYVILPEMQNVSAGTHRLTFKARVTSGVGHLDIGYLTDITDASTFTSFAVINPSNTVYGPVTIINIPGGLPGNARIAIANRSNAASIAHYWDDLSYQLMPSCPEPSFTPVTNITPNSVSVNWSSVNPAQAYQIIVAAQGAGPVGTPNTVPAGVQTFAVSGLAANTVYEAYVRSICGTDTSLWYGPQEFRTACLPTAAFYEDFESNATGSIVPLCWNRLLVGSASQTITTISAGAGVRGIYQFSAANTASYVILPVMQNVSSGTHRIRFKARLSVAGTGQLDVGYLTDITDAGTFVPIAPVIFNNITYGPEFNVPIPSGIPSNARIAIANRAVTPSTAIYWDELYYEPLPPCASPGLATFAVSGYGNGSLSWFRGGNETSWQVGYAPQGSGVPTNLTVVTTPTLAVSGLAIGAVQTAYIRAICTPDSSAWTNLDFSINYCASNATNIADTRITFVRMGADSVASPATTCAVYTDYTNLPPFTLRMGAPDSIIVKYGTCGGPFASFATVYVDFNRDLVFDNATEKIFEGNCSAGIDLAGLPTLPIVSGFYGVTRMRVVLREGGSATLNLPCGTYTYGETQDFSVNIVAPSPNDIGVTNVLSPSNTCVFSAQQQVTVAITNFGTSTQSGFPVSFSLSGGVPVTETVTDSVAMGQTINYTFTARANMYGPSVHTLTAFTSLATDTRAANDSSRKTVREAFSFSAGSDTTISLGNSVTLRSNTVQGPSGILGDLSQPSATSCGGGFMFDLRAPNANIFISGFDVLPVTAGSQTVSVYYKVGTKTGFQTNISAWTLEGTYTINPATTTSVVTMPISGFTLTAGQVYGIYLQYNNRYSSSGIDFSNADLVINNGEGLCTNWTTCCSPRYWRGRIYYGSNISFTWSDLTGNQLGTSDTLSVSPITTTAYVLTGSDGTCSRSDTVVVSVSGTIQPPVSGTLRYDNTSQTPMTNTTVRLLAGGSQITSVITNATGDFNFGPVPPGAYTLQYQTNKPWGGVNSVDALNITRHFSVVQPLSGLRLRVADVNNSNTVSATDALQVNQRFSFLRSSFTAGDWAYSLNTLTVPNDPTPIVLSGRALCLGDVNGSYSPNVNLRERWEDLAQSGEVFTGEGEYTVNVQLSSALNVGAVSLVLRVPVGMEVLGITTGLASSDEVVFNQIGNVVRIAWHTLQQWDVEQGGVLLSIRARGAADGGFALGAHESELANSWADVYGSFDLRTPRLVGSSTNYTGLTVYPNPSTAIFRVSSETAMQELVVRDLSGREVMRTLPVAGATELDLSAQRDGVYMLEVRLSDRTEQIRLVLRR